MGESLQSAESYLLARAPPTKDTEVRIVHTYDSCWLSSGLQLQIGTGLSLQHLEQALTFLGANVSGIEAPATEEAVVPLDSSTDKNEDDKSSFKSYTRVG